jgi:trehalose 6-phosphate phosphatase
MMGSGAPLNLTMRHLFSPDGETTLLATLQRQPLLAFDFDGTLTPIVPRPGDAYLSKAVAGRLATLARVLPVAIVTGRRVDDVRPRLGFEPRFIVGNHGAEQPDQQALSQAGAQALSAVRERLVQWQPRLQAAGVTVEDKVQSIALHYRLSRMRDQAAALISDLLQDHDPSLRVFGGKLVVNVVPSLSPDKWTAVSGLVRQCGAPCAIFAGDDVNDEPVFDAAPEDWLTIRVGRELPRSRARFFLDSPAEMALLLSRMVSLMARR